ncbi:MAG TPA: hypothetical protein VL053_06275 [Arachidicoccus sp.]|nr:hypothetical protein [Arachidicoccus sp.]
MNRVVLLLLLSITGLSAVHAQRLIRGHVFGARTTTSPVDSIELRTYSGSVAYSDRDGFYQINGQPEKDTLYVSYKGRDIMHYPISMITNPEKFDIYLQNPAFYDDSYANELEDVRVITRNYQTDSLSNRQLYGDIFDYTKPKFNPFHPITSVVNLFNQPYLNRQKRYQQFAVSNEKEGYVDSRFTRTYVARITGIQDDELLSEFMKKYRPTYAQVKGMVEIALGQYVLDCYKKFKLEKGIK